LPLKIISRAHSAKLISSQSNRGQFPIKGINIIPEIIAIKKIIPLLFLIDVFKFLI